MGPIQRFVAHRLLAHHVRRRGPRHSPATIDDFGPLEGEKKKAIRKGLKVMCRESQMGVAAAQRAVPTPGLGDGQSDPERIGVVFGSDYMLTLPDDFSRGILRCVDEEGNFDFHAGPSDGMPQAARRCGC